MLSRIAPDNAVLADLGMSFSQLATHLASDTGPLTSDQSLALAWSSAERAIIEQEQIGTAHKNAIRAARTKLETLSKNSTGNKDVRVLRSHIEKALVYVQDPKNQDQIKKMATTTKQYLNNQQRPLRR